MSLVYFYWWCVIIITLNIGELPSSIHTVSAPQNHQASGEIYKYKVILRANDIKSQIELFYIHREGILFREMVLILESTRLKLIMTKAISWEPFLGKKENEKFSTL